MPFSVKSKKTGATYYLHAQEAESRGGKRKLYFFSKQIKDGALDAVPPGYTVTESSQTGLPLLKRTEK